ncbi:ribonuclease HII [Candidatus Saccharibacteria bacterium]|nr:ribonuclease HII [Candidatus Saccharibacteria bacterium]
MAILGIDEVGRGPWAGPLVIGAVVLPNDFGAVDAKNPKAADTRIPKAAGESSLAWVNQLADSKKLTEKKRTKLSALILNEVSHSAGVMTGLGWVSAKELDKVGLSDALKLAARRALGNLLGQSDGKSGNGLPTQDNQKTQEDQKTQNAKKMQNAQEGQRIQSSALFSEIIIDGTQNFLIGTEYEAKVSVLPKADAKIREVSAASIIAKVARDTYMKKIAEKYPEYGFDKHVGYGTKLHKEALEKFGPCKEHRHSFRPVAEVLAINTLASKTRLEQKKDLASVCTTKQIGDKAEVIVAKYLKSLGHKILARNYKTKYYEIDIISATKDTIYFTEVKYRKNSLYGNPLDFVDRKKQEQMVFAAECFVQNLAQKLGRDIDTLPKRKLAVASVGGPKYQIGKWLVLE